MLQRSVLTGLVDQQSVILSTEHEEHSAEIARLAIAYKKKIQQSGSVEDHALHQAVELIDLCLSIDQDRGCAEPEAIAESVKKCRRDALRLLLRMHYNDERRQHPERSSVLREEQKISLMIAKRLHRLRRHITVVWGPLWMRSHSDAEFLDAVESYVYDLQSNKNDWEKFTRLLPRDLRERFDVTEESLIDIEIATEEQAVAAMKMVAQRYGLAPEQLGDPAKLLSLLPEIPVLRKAISFLAKRKEDLGKS